jgi:hypothetical protein
MTPTLDVITREACQQSHFNSFISVTYEKQGGSYRLVHTVSDRVVWNFTFCHGPSTTQPDAPNYGAEEKVGLLRSLRFRSGQAG